MTTTTTLNTDKQFNFAEYDKSDFTATYSPEDNKLRITANVRIDDDDYAVMKAMGWRWAPKQDLFYVSWSPTREDFAEQISGEIKLEKKSIVDRAEEKAERLAGYADNAAKRSNRYLERANQLSERFASGQPILIGHHSERSAVRAAERVERSLTASTRESSKVSYWASRINGVISHANRKNSDRTRIGRIEGLLKELRDLQKVINHANMVLTVGHNMGIEALAKRSDCNEDQIKKMRSFLTEAYDLRQRYADGEISLSEAVLTYLEQLRARVSSSNRMRRIQHTLNRLAYENSFFITPRYEGELTPAVLQAFLRTHGADKPKARLDKNTGQWTLSASVAMPLHLAEGPEMVLSDSGCRDLMEQLNYAVPEKKPAKPPILNFPAEKIIGAPRYLLESVEYPQRLMTKAEYQKIYKDNRGTSVSLCGTFRFRIVSRYHHENGLELFCVYLTDSKSHAIPDSTSVKPVKALSA